METNKSRVYISKPPKELQKRFLSSCKIDCVENGDRNLYQFLFKHVWSKEDGIKVMILNRPSILNEKELGLRKFVKKGLDGEAPNFKVLGIKEIKIHNQKKSIDLTGGWAKLFCRLIVFQKPPAEAWTKEDEKRIQFMSNAALT